MSDESIWCATETDLTIHVDHALASREALLKAVYWFSRDYVCDINEASSEGCSTVTLRSRRTPTLSREELRQLFLRHAIDFELRERVNQQTVEVRDLLLAKAFAESGVLEETPQGVFGDSLEESRPEGMFHILSNQ